MVYIYENVNFRSIYRRNQIRVLSLTAEFQCGWYLQLLACETCRLTLNVICRHFTGLNNMLSQSFMRFWPTSFAYSGFEPNDDSIVISSAKVAKIVRLEEVGKSLVYMENIIMARKSYLVVCTEGRSLRSSEKELFILTTNVLNEVRFSM